MTSNTEDTGHPCLCLIHNSRSLYLRVTEAQLTASLQFVHNSTYRKDHDTSVTAKSIRYCCTMWKAMVSQRSWRDDFLPKKKVLMRASCTTQREAKFDCALSSTTRQHRRNISYSYSLLFLILAFPHKQSFPGKHTQRLELTFQPLERSISLSERNKINTSLV